MISATNLASIVSFLMAKPDASLIYGFLGHAKSDTKSKESHCFSIVDNPQPYMPHLSLLYGDLPKEDKQKAKVKEESFNHLLCNKEFELSNLCCYKTNTQDKSLQLWEKVVECNLRDYTESEN
ncbi:hypothetical protein SUGI_0751590 [Cryptomeria japonica]|nr:hypothetical protein SUGI_0751590 [Cryptomeria japonica]